MGARRGKRRSRRLFGALALLFLLALLLPLADLLPGLLPGGGRLRDPRTPRQARLLPAPPLSGTRMLVPGTGRPGRELSIVREARRGTVRDADGGAVEATVRLLGPHGEPLAESRTDEQGDYELPADPRAAAVCAERPGRAPAIAVAGDLVLPGDGDAIEGHLAGAAGGLLEICGDAPLPGEDRRLPFRARWPVGPDGSFRGVLPRGARAFGSIEGRPFVVRGGEVELPAAARLRGRVLRPDGSPAADAALACFPLLDGGALPAGLPPRIVATDAEGRVDAAGFAAVDYVIEIRAPGCAVERFDAAPPGGEPFEFRLRRGFALFGRVADAAGRPLAGARVRALGLPEEEADQPILEAQADFAGGFRVEGLAGRAARVRVEAEGFFPTTLDGVAPGAGLRVVLQRR